jgi:hypothetical protein
MTLGQRSNRIALTDPLGWDRRRPTALRRHMRSAGRIQLMSRGSSRQNSLGGTTCPGPYRRRQPKQPLRPDPLR